MKKLSKIFLITMALCLSLAVGAAADDAAMAEAYLDVMSDVSDRFDNWGEVLDYNVTGSQLIDMDGDGVSELCLAGELDYYHPDAGRNCTSPTYEIFYFDGSEAVCSFSQELYPEIGDGGVDSTYLVDTDDGIKIFSIETAYAGSITYRHYFIYDLMGNVDFSLYSAQIGMMNESDYTFYNAIVRFANSSNATWSDDNCIAVATRDSASASMSMSAEYVSVLTNLVSPYNLAYADWAIYAKDTVGGYNYTGSCVSELEAMLVVEEEEISEKDMVSSWAMAEVEAARALGLVTERTEEYMTAYISRLAFAELIVNFVETVTGEEIDPAAEDTFLDTSNIAALKAYNAGIVNGMSEGIFGPAYVTNRQDIATMIFRALDYIYEETGINLTPETGDLSAFTDASDVSSYAIEAVATLAANGIMNGTSSTSLSPKQETSIEMGVLLIYRLFQQI